MYSLTAWDAANLKSIKKRLFKAGIDDKMSKPADFLKLTNTIDYFNELNKKRGFLPPNHQKWLLSKLDYISERYNMFCEEDLGRFRVAMSCPPRGSKTEILRSFVFRILLENPYLRVLYITNSSTNVKKTSSQVRGYLRDVGVIFSQDINNATEFVIDQVPGHTLENVVCGGGLSAFTPLTLPNGVSADVIIVDDLYKSREDAESTPIREKIEESFLTNAMTRLTNCGCVLVVSTRYHPQDIIAKISDENFSEKFEYFNLPAITVDDNGKEISYWPAYWPIDKLKKIRARDLYTWQTLYQGNPKPKGNTLFSFLNRYDTQTPLGSKYVWACDLAYSTNTRSDYTALCKMALHQSTNTYYVERIYRWKSGIDETLKRIKELVGDNTVHFSWGGTELSVVEVAKEKYNLNINAIKTSMDKYNRALKMSSAINNVLFHASIEKDVIDEIEAFSGDDRGHDDTVDATVSAFNVLSGNDDVEIKYKSFEQANTEMQHSLGSWKFKTNTFGKSIDADDEDFD